MAWLQDIKYSLRMLKRSPFVSAVIVVCIALAIGLNGTIFSLVNALVFRELPVEQPDRLVRLFQAGPGFPYASFSYPNYRDVRDRNQVFSGVCAGAILPVDLSSDTGTDRAAVEIVSGNYFEVLGVEAQLGRLFTQQDDINPGGHPVVVISHSLWQERFGGVSSVVGESVVMNGQPFTIIGVVNPEFRGGMLVANIDLWAPLAMEPVVAPANDRLESRGSGWLFLTTARLAEGETIDSARASLALLDEQMSEENGWSEDGFGFTVRQLSETVVAGPEPTSALNGSSAMLLIMAFLVLLVACANVANLLLARSESRRREMSIRIATGAQRFALVRQLLTESVVLAIGGGVLGLILAFVCSRLLPRLVPDIGLPLRLDLPIEGRVLFYTSVITIATGLIFGLAPALRALSTDVVSGLRGDAPMSTHTRGLRGLLRRWSLSRVLVVSQVGLSLLLLVGAGLFLRSMEATRTADPGFDTGNILLADIDPSLQGLSRDGVDRLYQDLRTDLLGKPGVERVTFADVVPMSPFNSQQNSISVQGYEPSEGERMNPDYNVVADGYFEAIGIEMAEGRAFSPTDTAESEPVLVINKTMAQRYWKPGQALGGVVSVRGVDRRVVGITEEHRWKGANQEPAPYVYVISTQMYSPAMSIVVKTTGDPTALAGPLRDSLARLAPAVALNNVRTFEEHAAIALFPSRVGAGFLSGFGLLALVLAAIGLFGVLNHSVSQRSRELGIRMALGATRRDVLGQVVGSGMTLVAVGLVVGLLGALVLGRLLSGFLFGVAATDAVALTAATLTLVGAALFACYLPARRASRIDPWSSIKAD